MGADLPAGTVTFLFTDVEGATKLLDQLGDAYADALEEHRRVLRGCMERHAGVEVDTQGDAFFIAFGSARAAHGVWWVSLSGLNDPQLVLATAAQVVGAKQDLAVHIGDRRMLLLFDTFEHVAETAPGVSALLAACPTLRCLVTSREPLHVSGEQLYAVPPLAESEAVSLFAERAGTHELPADGHSVVSEICRRLDCLPLAVELAAARTNVLPPELLLRRLNDRLPLLTGGPRDAPERHRTLRATIAWSHDLLSPEAVNPLRELHGDPTAYVTWYRARTDDPFGGYHAWRPGISVKGVMEFMRRPDPNEAVHICGEAYSDQQGWVEGALCVAERMLQDHFRLRWPGWLDSNYYLGW